MKKFIKTLSIALSFALVFSFASCGYKGSKDDNPSDINLSDMKVKILILPHFEIGELSGDDVGEAQLYFEKYLKEGEKYSLNGGFDLYYSDSNQVALCVTGSGKVNTATALTCALSDNRFDFSDTYILGVGCGGGATGFVTLGDVCIASAACDNDLGHTADIREMGDNSSPKWFHDSSYDDVSYKALNTDLVLTLYDLTKDIELNTTDLSLKTMKENYKGEEWANRMPKVLVGTCMSSDNFWKGVYDHDKANEICSFYGTEYPYAITEMEDVVIADVADRFGLLDKTIIIRCCVNTDTFMQGSTPEMLWGDSSGFNNNATEENNETLDIFPVAMQNHFSVGSTIIDYLLEN